MVVHATEVLSCAFDPSHEKLHGIKNPADIRSVTGADLLSTLIVTD